MVFVEWLGVASTWMDWACDVALVRDIKAIIVSKGVRRVVFGVVHPSMEGSLKRFNTRQASKRDFTGAVK
jgi:hypothetical protein